MELHIIVAMTEDYVIGKDGGIPWRIKQDMELFKKLTMGNTVIMGRRTWESLPQKFRPLPGRNNIIVSSTMGEVEGARVCRSLEEGMEIAEEYGKEVFCIGGAQLYGAALPVADFLHISMVKLKYGGDTLFPKVNWDEWSLVKREEFEEFIYGEYSRRRSRNQISV